MQIRIVIKKFLNQTARWERKVPSKRLLPRGYMYLCKCRGRRAEMNVNATQRRDVNSLSTCSEMRRVRNSIKCMQKVNQNATCETIASNFASVIILQSRSQGYLFKLSILKISPFSTWDEGRGRFFLYRFLVRLILSENGGGGIPSRDQIHQIGCTCLKVHLGQRR